MLCEYGCNQEAKYLLKSGKWCCCESYKKCPEIIKKNKKGQQKVKQLKECPYCHCLITSNMGNQYNLHINKCKKEYEKKQLLESKDISKYVKWYNNIIKYRQEHPLLEGYKEKHHILPRSLGGSNDNSNLIYLTAREHYICHMLLVEIYSKDRKSYTKMLSAFMLMKTREEIKISSRLYEYYKIELSKIKKKTGCGENNNVYGRIWIHNNELQINKMIKKEEIDIFLNEKWERGIIFNWELYFNKLKKKQEKENHYNKQLELFRKYYKIYRELGWEGFVKETDYKYSRQNLIQRFRKFLKEEFIPQNQNPKKKK